MALKVYCIGSDEQRNATQADLDRMQRQLNVLGAFFCNLERMVRVTRDGINLICNEEKENA